MNKKNRLSSFDKEKTRTFEREKVIWTEPKMIYHKHWFHLMPNRRVHVPTMTNGSPVTDNIESQLKTYKRFRSKQYSLLIWLRRNWNTSFHADHQTSNHQRGDLMLSEIDWSHTKSQLSFSFCLYLNSSWWHWKEQVCVILRSIYKYISSSFHCEWEIVDVYCVTPW